MSEKVAKQLRKDNQVTVVLDKDVALWLKGFFAALLAPMKIDDLTRDAINARQTLKAVQKGCQDVADTDTTVE